MHVYTLQFAATYVTCGESKNISSRRH